MKWSSSGPLVSCGGGGEAGPAHCRHREQRRFRLRDSARCRGRASAWAGGSAALAAVGRPAAEAGLV